MEKVGPEGHRTSADMHNSINDAFKQILIPIISLFPQMWHLVKSFKESKNN